MLRKWSNIKAMLDKPTVDFIDIPSDFWAVKAIQIASSGGFIAGFSDRTFRPDQNVQRIQVIVSLVNGLGLVPNQNHSSLSYTDKNAIPEYAKLAVIAASQQNIVINYPDPKILSPTREATRAEVVAMTYQPLS